jgi:hypothetical protein
MSGALQAMVGAAAAGYVRLTGETINNVGSGSGVELTEDGVLNILTGSGSTRTERAGQWYGGQVAGVGDRFEALCNVVSGSLSGSITGTWIPLSSTRFWTVSGSPASATFRVSIRTAGSTVAIASALFVASNS